MFELTVHEQLHKNQISGNVTGECGLILSFFYHEAQRSLKENLDTVPKFSEYLNKAILNTKQQRTQRETLQKKNLELAA
jgi:hypothetical protein